MTKIPLSAEETIELKGIIKFNRDLSKKIKVRGALAFFVGIILYTFLGITIHEYIFMLVIFLFLLLYLDYTLFRRRISRVKKMLRQAIKY